MTSYTLATAEGVKELESSFNDLLFSKARTTILVTAAILVVGAIGLLGTASTGLLSRLFGLSAAFALASFVAYRTVDRRYLLALTLWHVALAAVIIGACFAFGQAEILLLAAILPLLAAITLGWQAAALAELGLVGLLLWLQATPALAPMSTTYAGLILLFGALGGLVGWSATAHLITVTRWSLNSLEQARVSLDDAREKRMVLLQTQEDLTKANQELTRLAAAPQGAGPGCRRGAPGKGGIRLKRKPRTAHAPQHDHWLCRNHRQIAPSLPHTSARRTADGHCRD